MNIIIDNHIVITTKIIIIIIYWWDLWYNAAKCLIDVVVILISDNGKV